MLKTLHVTNRDQWRAWLADHHKSETDIWLIFFKKHAAKPGITYDHAVEEALCFGWIDSIVRRIDDQRYAQKFTPRRDSAKWSSSNIQRMRMLIRDGRMTQAGLAKFDPKLLEKEPRKKQAPKKTRDPKLPQFVRQALIANPMALEHFETLPPSHRRRYLQWILSAKKEETRERRLKQAVSMLQQKRRM
ncbi:MAG: YdeI/OmpD-associated family protein [Tepidisphaeraceae bacterium]|jgi:uncharacterized protein YdeI (YjbR/CyaY-like superfamily)